MRKSILVTGGTKGIGRAIIERFAKEGFDIYTCARNEGDLLALKKSLEEKYPEIKVLAIAADLSKKEEVNSFADKVKSMVIPDILVNNAAQGIHTPPQDTSLEEWNRVIGTSLTGYFLNAREFARLVIPAKKPAAKKAAKSE